MTPIYATSTYVQASPGKHQGYEYSRTQNPTRMAYEACVASLEGGVAGFAFASGLAAASTTLELLDAGSHVIAMNDLYGGTYRLVERVRRRTAGLEFDFIDLNDPAALKAALKPNTRMIWAETPTNPMLQHPCRRQHLLLAHVAAAHRIWCRPRTPLGDQVPEWAFRHRRRCRRRSQ